MELIDVPEGLDGVAVSATRIGDVLGGAAVSIGNVHRLVNCLVKRGWITHIPEHARSMTIIRSPWSLSPAPVKEGVEA